MITVLDSNAVDCEFEPRLNQNFEIVICCFCANNAALRSKNNDWLAWN
jgi:hypothetical protein